MTVAENIAFGLRVARWPEATSRERVRRDGGAHRGWPGWSAATPTSSRAGQQQRVALARALARRPQILLLDEPLSALDAKIRLRLRGELRKIQQDLGITTVYVTHDQEEALSIADRIAVMREGRIEQIGTPGGDLRRSALGLRGGLHRHLQPPGLPRGLRRPRARGVGGRALPGAARPARPTARPW